MTWHTMLGVDPFSGASAERADDPHGAERSVRDVDPRTRTAGARRAAVAILVLAVTLLAVVMVTAIHRRAAAARYPVTAEVLAQARAGLASLPTTATPPASPYDREAFGQAWADVDHNGCDTRNDVLARDLTEVTTKPGTHACVVLTGLLDDPYTGRTITFQRGPRSGDVQIDHVVALANAWASGASTWTPARRRELANDPRNLLAVDGPANQRKSASNASQWLPPQQGYRCVYVVKQIEVKAAYGLSVTPAEARAMSSALGRCVVAPPGREPPTSSRSPPSGGLEPTGDRLDQPAAGRRFSWARRSSRSPPSAAATRSSSTKISVALRFMDSRGTKVPSSRL